MVSRAAYGRCARALVAAAGLAVACGGATKQAGGLEVVISTNLTAPTAYNKLEVSVAQEIAPGGSFDTLFDQTSAVGVTGGVTLPTTVAITAGSAADQLALVTVTALLGTKIVIQDVARVQVPTDRVAELDVFLGQACVGIVCASGETCAPTTGSCVSNVVTMLPSYEGDGGVEASMDDGSLGGTSSGLMSTSAGTGTSTTGGSTSSSSGSGGSGGVGSSGTATTSSSGTSGTTATTGTSTGTSGGTTGTSSTSSGTGTTGTSGTGTGGSATSSGVSVDAGPSIDSGLCGGTGQSCCSSAPICLPGYLCAMPERLCFCPGSCP